MTTKPTKKSRATPNRPSAAIQPTAQAIAGDKERLLDAMRLSKGSLLNLAYVLYASIRDAHPDIRGELVRFVAENWDDAVQDRSDAVSLGEPISRGDLKDLVKRYQKTVDEMLISLVSQDLAEDDFYGSLWTIVDNPFFKDDAAHAFALYDILIDKHIPYFRLDSGLRMSNDDFKQRLEALKGPRRKVRFILTRHFDQKTEQADLALREILALDEPDRIVLMAYLIVQAPGKASSPLIDVLRELAT